VGLYLANYQPPPHHPPPSRDPLAVARITGEVLGMALGMGGSGISPVWWAVLIGMLALGVVTITQLVPQASDQAERPASVGLIAVVAGVAGIALAVGIGRAEFGPGMGLWSRYALLMWPLLGAAYLAWVKAGRGAEPVGLRKWVPAGLCVAAALAYVANAVGGVYVGVHLVQKNAALEADAQAGVPDAELIARHFPGSRNEFQEERATWAIPMLRDAGVSVFATGERRGGHPAWWIYVVLAALTAVVLLGRWLWHLGWAVQVERARELFRLQHERYEDQLLKAASATGLPRGLRWLSCEITGDAVLVRDAGTGSILALVPVLIRFEPEAGSDMEQNPAAREPRPATAVFGFHHGTWQTAGRVVFNHTPEQTAAAFGPQVRVIHHGHH
jgi:hypothetical protein